MARVTVEDCIVQIPNRFELVLLAAQRARNIGRGEEMTIDRDNDKNPVVALREIAETTIDLAAVEADLVKSLQRDINALEVHADFLSGRVGLATDTTLLRLNTAPPAGVSFAGFSTSPPAVGTAVTGIHHPKGDLQKISFGSVRQSRRYAAWPRA